MNPAQVKDTMLEMNWKEIEASAEKGALVLLPIASIEAHGPHLPVGTGIFLAQTRCRLIREELKKRGKEAVIAPPFYWGMSNFAESYPGSFSTDKNSLVSQLMSIFSSLKAAGFKSILGMNVNARKVHIEALLCAFKKGSEALGMNIRLNAFDTMIDESLIKGDEDYVLTIPPANSGRVSSAYPDILAGDTETASMKVFYPEYVDIELASSLKPVLLFDEKLEKWLEGGKAARELAPGGYIGAPAEYTNVEEDFADYVCRVCDAATEMFKL